MTRVLIDDGSRHTELTGYGNLSRAIVSALYTHTDLKLHFRNRRGSVPNWVRDKDLLDRIPYGESDSHDCVLHISSPGREVGGNKPNLIYTQNALSMLKPDWVEGLRGADAVIVPGEFDARVFRDHFDNVHICHQFVDDKTFRPKPSFRNEGPDTFSFLFVGSFGYRKGLDLLLQAFPEAFDMGQKVNLTLHCFSGFEADRFSYLIEAARGLPDNLSLQVYNGSRTPDWMSRVYNQHDVIISLSRGEGWCMPLHEGLLSHKPVVAPDSTAMGEYLPETGVLKVPTRARIISEITDPLGESIRKQYGFPGNQCFEPDLDASVSAMRRIYFDYQRYTEEAQRGRDFIVNTYTKKSMAQKIQAAIESVL